MNTGYITFYGKEYIYIEDNEKMHLVAKNKNDIDIVVMPDNFKKKDYFLKYSSDFHSCCQSYIIDTQYNNAKDIILTSKYTLNLIKDEISGIEITGEVIDAFFSPARYYFQKKRENGSTIMDLIYDREEIDSWEINYNTLSLKISLICGDILQKGIASDLKLHPKIIVEFIPTSDYKLVYEIYQFIVRFMRLVVHTKNCGKFKVELYNYFDKKKSYIGFLNDYSIKTDAENSHFDNWVVNYTTYKPYIKRLLQFAANNPDLSFNHFPLNFQRISSEDYTVIDLLTLFSAFEKECSHNKSMYETIDDSMVKTIKEELLTLINDLKKNCQTDKEKEFLNNAKNRISQLNTQMGQKAKIVNAFTVLQKALNSSLINIFINTMSEVEKINVIADSLTQIRGKSIHADAITEFTEQEAQMLRFFEVLIYAQMLKRAGLNDEEIEAVVGAVLHCNYILVKKIIND